ncbi:replication-associated recombination protein A [candidate division KSB1 bacterium]|nr:replication-associated recombination protein A [candidate division KSB1 bacterium]
MRPKSLDEFFGQEHLVGSEGVLRKHLENKSIGSMIFWGPPGCGKTTLARILAGESDMDFHQVSAVSAGVNDVKKIIKLGSYNLKSLGKGTILFIDEIHRFNKAQQDVLLQSVEEGVLYLIGATTENPSFEVISPLLSRCRIYKLTALSRDELSRILNIALKSDEKLVDSKAEISKKVETALIALSGGDARIMLNALESAVQLARPGENGKRNISVEIVENVMQRKTLLYDKKGEYHYDIISAFIKSVRGSDPDAAAYWLGRMLDGGEDPKFIARRMIILASEDIGNADPSALPLATAAFTAVNYVGMPEAEYILMHAATYLASTVKSNSVAKTLSAVKKEIKEGPNVEVPLHIRNAPTGYMASEGYGKGYKYPHNFPESFVHQEYLPKELRGKIFYEPSENGIEKKLKERLIRLWEKRRK